MVWTGFPATQATDWSQIDFFNQIILAVLERIDAAGYQAVTAVGVPPWQPTDASLLQPVLAGDEVQSMLRFRRMQRALEEIASRFVIAANVSSTITSVDPDDVTTTDLTYLLDYAETNNWFWQWADVKIAAGLNASGWTRKRPREISGTGDAGAIGQVARHLVDAKIYEHDGGSWVLSEDQDQKPDTITAYGRMEAGDYIGYWIFNELKAVCDIYTTRVFVSASLYTGPASYFGDFGILDHVSALPVRGKFGSGSGSSFAAAKAAALADYNADPGQRVIGAWAQLRNNEDDLDYDANISKTDFFMYVDIPNSNLNGVTATFDLYVWSGPPDGSGGFASEVVYDAQGYSLTEGACVLLSAGNVVPAFTDDGFFSHTEIDPFPGAADTPPSYPDEPVWEFPSKAVMKGFSTRLPGGDDWIFAIATFNYVYQE